MLKAFLLDNSTLSVDGSASVVAGENCTVEVGKNSFVFASRNCTVFAGRDSTVFAGIGSIVEAGKGTAIHFETLDREYHTHLVKQDVFRCTLMGGPVEEIK